MKKYFIAVVSLFLILGSLTVVLADNDTKNIEEDEEIFKLGVDVLLDDEKELIEDKRVGLITNPTGVDQELNSIVDRLHHDPDVERSEERRVGKECR